MLIMTFAEEEELESLLRRARRIYGHNHPILHAYRNGLYAPARVLYENELRQAPDSHLIGQCLAGWSLHELLLTHRLNKNMEIKALHAEVMKFLTELDKRAKDKKK